MASKPELGDLRQDSDFEGVPEEMLEERTKEFRQLLFAERKRIMSNARRTLTEEMTVDQDDLADEMDLASADQNQSLSFRLRGRERHLLAKIDEALERLDDEEYWWCDSCEAWIGFRRLRARLVTKLCIVCKENQERRERVYA